MDYLYGVLDLSFWSYVIVTIVMLQTTIAGVTLYLHRDQTHRAVDLHPIVRHFFRFWLWLTTGINTREWVAIHRKHHARCETEDDPHSPKAYGLKTVLLEGAELYRAEAKNEETVEKYGRGAPGDWIERNLYERCSYCGVVLMAVVDLVLFGLPGIIIFGLQMMNIPAMAAGVINGLGHHTGYRNFECEDASTNIVPWAFLLGGEELHNNHHAFPSSAKFSSRKWEFDIGWAYLTLLSAVGLADVRRVAPVPVIEKTENPVDLDTLRAIIINRMHVLRNYTRTVTMPVFKSELQVADSPTLREKLREARVALFREPLLLDEAASKHLKDLLERNQALKTVHEFQQELRELWNGAHMSNERMVAKLREWCVRAEATGIAALEDFAASLRGYRLQGGTI